MRRRACRSPPTLRAAIYASPDQPEGGSVGLAIYCALRTETAGSGCRPHSQPDSATANTVPSNCAAMKGRMPPGAMPANVFDKERAMVTVGLANDVEAVNQ